MRIMAVGNKTLDATPNSAAPGDLGWHLGMVLRGYQSRFEDAVEGMPGGIRGYQVLSAVIHRDPANQQALGAHLGIDRTVLTYLLDSLEKDGVVERVPAPSDRRARKVLATDHGRELLVKYEERVASAESALLAGLEPAEESTLIDLIGRLAMDVHRAQPGSNPCEAMDHLP
ncbi:DNA-binding MarR family transcriptional regulator [Citricoccus muralis]|uniref:DNA-binding MarR family transcriptional regulator n=2 Tax=Citricoccus muralis TaxID=169134 RepID=A0A3D9LCU3_9MICC|nr:DNA-binding MarR family transcriptional regulator [Citricoccus muralis]